MNTDFYIDSLSPNSYENIRDYLYNELKANNKR